MLGHISAACSESWYRKLEFCFTSFWFYYHRLWWKSWHAMLALFLLYVFLVWIFSWRDLFQVTGTDASCGLYIICSQFITFGHVALSSAYCAWFVALLTSPYAVLLRTCCYLFLAQFKSSVYIRFSTEDSDHVISYVVVLIVDIKDNYLYVIFGNLLVWRRSDLFIVSL